MQTKGKPKANQKQAAAHTRQPALPKGWRQEVVEMLKKDGINIHPQTITNIISGKRGSLLLQEKVQRYRQKIAKRQAAKAAAINRLAKVS